MRFPGWRRRREQDLATEIQVHLQEAVRERMERGEAREQAEAGARRQFGNVGLVKEVTRDMWGWGAAERIARDMRYGLRQLRRKPGFATVAVLTFALGIGANTVIFSVVNGVLLRSLPYPEPDRLVIPWQTAPSWQASPNPRIRAISDRVHLSYPVYQDWLEENRVFENLGIYSYPGSYVAAAGGEVDLLRGFQVTHGVFAALGVPPILGRTFVPEDDQVGRPRLVVLGHGLWQRWFGSDSAVIGRTMILNEQPFTIVGVMPQGFDFPGGSEIWTTFNHAHPMVSDRDAHTVLPVARLRPNVTLDQAQSEMEIIDERLEAIPGVTALAATSAGPFLRTMSRDIMAETLTGQVCTSSYFDYVTPSYFHTIGIPLLAGRTFFEDESSPAAPVVIVNEAMARAVWPNEPAIGKRIGTSETVDGDSPWLTVVGVVGDVRHRLDADPHLTIYFPMRSEIPRMVMKTGIDPISVLEGVRTAVQDVDPAILISELRILEDIIDESIAGPRLRTVLSGALAALAAILAVVGIFGVLACTVAQRTKEIGIRIAVGATTVDVIRSAVNRGLVLLGLGAAVGFVVSLWAVGALEGFLFEVNPMDPATLLSATLLLTVASLGACFFPARRATKVNPVEALRRE